MTAARSAIVAGVVAAAAAAALLLLRDGRSPSNAPAEHGGDEMPAGSSRLKAKPSTAAPGRTPAPGPSSPVSADPNAAALDEFERVIASGDVARARAAARDLRRLLRTNRTALEMAIARLGHTSLSSDARCALALVLGTLPGEAGALADKALASGLVDDQAFARCVMLALGAQREPAEDDDVFGLGDRPHGAKGPAGLGITVRRLISSRGPPEVGYALRFGLGSDDPQVREAAGTALAESVRTLPDDEGGRAWRTTVGDVLGREGSDDVASALGEPLAAWAAGAGATAPAAEREAAVGAVLARLGEPDFDTYRFQLEDSFERLPLTVAQRGDLARLTAPATPFPVRSFAISALLRTLARRPSDEAVRVVRSTLLLAIADSDAAVRDLGARGLASLPYDKPTSDALASLVRRDPAWNVRFTAMESFAKVAPRDEALALLRAAKGDADSRVADRATELLAAVER